MTLRGIFFAALILMSFWLTACSDDNSSNNGVYVISGTITHSGSALSGVTVALSGSATNSTITDASGNYSFSVSSGSYTITPSMTSYTFSPTSANVTISNANSTGNNFTSTTSTQSQLLTNNSFESGLTGWTTDTKLGAGATGTCSYNAEVAPGTETLTSLAGFPATDGTMLALGSVSQLTGGAQIISCVLYQDVSIPVGATTATISFDVGIKNALGNNNNHNAARVGLYSTASVPAFGDSVVAGNSVDYAQATNTVLSSQTSSAFNISSKAGTTVRFAIINAANSTGHENIGIDNAKLKVTVVQ